MRSDRLMRLAVAGWLPSSVSRPVHDVFHSVAAVITAATARTPTLRTAPLALSWRVLCRAIGTRQLQPIAREARVRF